MLKHETPYDMKPFRFSATTKHSVIRTMTSNFFSPPPTPACRTHLHVADQQKKTYIKNQN